MKRTAIFYQLFLGSILFVFPFVQETGGAPRYKEGIVTYKSGGVELKGFVVYDENMKEKRPAVLVVPEWWGVNNYVRSRARQLATLGYIAMAADIFGNGKTASDPKEAQALTALFYQNPQLAYQRLEAAINKIKGYKQTDTKNIAAIGYCFGGAVVLNSAKLGAPLKGVVSFHGTLAGVVPRKNLLKAKILVCHGADDKFTPPQEVQKFRHQLDSVGADYVFKIYPDATHAFTNPDATKLGKQFNIPIAYNAEADKNSWSDMKQFLNRLFKK
jgi:dienelactone hydrolase